MMGSEIAHDINNPMTWLQLNLSSLLDDLDQTGTLEPAYARELLEECKQGIARITEVVAILRKSGAPEPHEIEETDLRQVVAAACSLAPLTETGEVVVRSELAQVPRLSLAPGRVGQAIWSLLVLCVRHVTAGDGHTAIDVRLHDDGRYVYVDFELGLPLALSEEVLKPGAVCKGPRELRMARAVFTVHGGLVMALPSGHGLRIRLPIEPIALQSSLAVRSGPGQDERDLGSIWVG
jgi:hypothetical protein